jgi:NAD(P)-dependent dehydrogenase (short-subunit alcohol dehydrogenase family)
VADRNLDAANALAESINNSHLGSAVPAQVNVASWEEQVSAFSGAVERFGQIDYVYAIAGIGEKRWLPKGITSETVGFVKPDLEVQLRIHFLQLFPNSSSIRFLTST